MSPHSLSALTLSVAAAAAAAARALPPAAAGPAPGVDDDDDYDDVVDDDASWLAADGVPLASVLVGVAGLVAVGCDRPGAGDARAPRPAAVRSGRATLVGLATAGAAAGSVSTSAK